MQNSDFVRIVIFGSTGRIMAQHDATDAVGKLEKERRIVLGLVQETLLPEELMLTLFAQTPTSAKAQKELSEAVASLRDSVFRGPGAFSDARYGCPEIRLFIESDQLIRYDFMQTALGRASKKQLVSSPCMVQPRNNGLVVVSAAVHIEAGLDEQERRAAAVVRAQQIKRYLVRAAPRGSVAAYLESDDGDCDELTVTLDSDHGIAAVHMDAVVERLVKREVVRSGGVMETLVNRRLAAVLYPQGSTALADLQMEIRNDLAADGGTVNFFHRRVACVGELN